MFITSYMCSLSEEGDLHHRSGIPSTDCFNGIGVLKWMNKRQYQIREIPKTTEQFYFSGIFSEATKKSYESNKTEEEGFKKKNEEQNFLEKSLKTIIKMKYLSLRLKLL